MRYRVNDAKVAWRVADGEGVLLHADTSAYFGLNRTGTLLWGALAGGRQSADELIAWTRLQFPAAPPGLASEVTAFLQKLEEHDLLDREAPGEAASPAPPADGETGGLEYEAPLVLAFGELEKLILSGE